MSDDLRMLLNSFPVMAYTSTLSVDSRHEQTVSVQYSLRENQFRLHPDSELLVSGTTALAAQLHAEDLAADLIDTLHIHYNTVLSSERDTRTDTLLVELGHARITRPKDKETVKSRLGFVCLSHVVQKQRLQTTSFQSVITFPRTFFGRTTPLMPIALIYMQAGVLGWQLPAAFQDAMGQAHLAYRTRLKALNRAVEAERSVGIELSLSAKVG